ncbi:MAG: Zn-ribbon domain-containing OB-fold protein [Nitrososphaerota archaeon]|jgi:uncharacterized OB-fold protein|nr:Zn-ribbon domain-containing OB-fold protein [Nitrososphaerota archaeon]
MNIQEPFSIEQFYKLISQDKLMAGKCLKCGKLHLPPRPLCDNCYNTQFEWIPISNKGKLLTYTVIHIAPPQFHHLAPYTIGIIELDDNLKLPGVIQNISHEQLKIGMHLTVHFDSCNESQTWPPWPKYHLKPVDIIN